MERLVQDLKFAGRVLWKDRGFAATALLTLGICIGANAAIFAIVNSVVLRSLPVPDSDRLVILYNSYPKAGVERASTGVPDYYDRLRETDVFEEQALYQMRGQTIGGETDPQRLTGMAVRPSFFRLLRGRPLRGRIFNEDEGEIGRERVTILSYALWQQLFGGAESAIGRELRVNGLPHVIVGVIAFLALGLVTRQSVAAWRPWLWLFALALWNETVDLWVERWPDPGMQYGEGAKDLMLTMVLPTVLLLAARLRPELFRPAARQRASRRR